MLKGLHNHWTKKGGCLMPKRAFASKDEAHKFMADNGIKDAVYKAYECADCGKWHIGHRK